MLIPPRVREDFSWELAAEGITVRIRWFGLCVGYLLVNLIDRQSVNRPAVNAILALGAMCALLDTFWSYQGKVFLKRWPLIISLMEAVFIGLLCHFDAGLDSPFRFYYFLSLLVCAMRWSPGVTYSTLALHALSFAALAFSRNFQGNADFTTPFLMLVFMGWVTWASTSLAGLLQSAGRKLAQLNTELKDNQLLLEQRIAQRTRELQQSQALIVQQEKQAAFGLLAAGIAHEVGNPLAAISSLVQMLNRRNPDDYTRERLQMVDDQLRRIQRTLRELVDFSRPATTQRSMCDVHAIIDAALNIAKYYKRTKGKRISTCYAEGLPRLKVVRDQLVQVFLNLILNAMDATEEGGLIEITTKLEGGWVEIAIRDDGHGIDSTCHARIFQAYFTTKPTGTGLGLFVCKNIVEQQMEGRIELAASSPQGTTFVVFLTCDNVRNHPDLHHSQTVSTEVIRPAADLPGLLANGESAVAIGRSSQPGTEES